MGNPYKTTSVCTSIHGASRLIFPFGCEFDDLLKWIVIRGIWLLDWERVGNRVGAAIRGPFGVGITGSPYLMNHG